MDDLSENDSRYRASEAKAQKGHVLIAKSVNKIFEVPKINARSVRLNKVHGPRARAWEAH